MCDVQQQIINQLKERGLADEAISALLQTSYRLFDVKGVYHKYHDTLNPELFRKQKVCVFEDNCWVEYEVGNMVSVFDGFLAFRINDDQRVERVIINNHTKWKWPNTRPHVSEQDLLKNVMREEFDLKFLPEQRTTERWSSWIDEKWNGLDVAQQRLLQSECERINTVMRNDANLPG